MPAIEPQADGIAVNFAKGSNGGPTNYTLRLQIQGPNGHKADADGGADDRWCANITEPNGKVFIPYTAFDKKCWFVDIVDGMPVTNNPELHPTVMPYAGEPISAVVFSIPGNGTGEGAV
jgi:hypothetical protein